MKKFDAIIIGAGVIGCSLSLALARRGIKTLNVDALPSAGYGSTSHSSAIVRPFYSHETACALAHEARHRWLDWREFLGYAPGPIARYIETGGLILVRDGTDHQYENNLSILDKVGVEFQRLSPREIEKKYPGMSLRAFGPPKCQHEEGFGEPVAGEITSGIFMPASGYVSDPQLAARNLQVAAEHEGSTFSFNIRVTDILQEGGAISGVQLSEGGIVRAPTVVNAAGPHSSVINDMSGITSSLNLRTRPHRHEVNYLAAPPGYRHNAGFIVDLDAGVYQRPDSTDMLIGSADPDCDPPEVVDPDDYNDRLTAQWTAQAVRAAQRWPELGIENNARGTVGLYDVSDDWIPIYDRTDLPGFYLAIGTSGNQFKNAPVVGDLMAAVIENRDHDSSPSLLNLENLKRSIDLSFYSRNRTIQETASVMA
ncbi:MAG: FAD-binding oxidoreductase [Gammaproteobacteria bacterium]|nr:FAD-binding oxidoreductase [Gammaproteobacteria bacterium]